MATLLCIADVHEDLNTLDTFVNDAMYRWPQATLVVAGDLALRPYTVEDLRRFERTRNSEDFIAAAKEHNDEVMRRIKGILDNSGWPYFIVPGNYDNLLSGVFGEHDIHNRCVEICGLRAIGYGGAGTDSSRWIGPPHIKPLVDLGQIVLEDREKLKELFEEHNPQMVLAHNPPFGQVDEMFDGRNAGSVELLELLLDSEVVLGVYGHIHEAGPVSETTNGLMVFNNLPQLRYFVNPGNLGTFSMINPKTLESMRNFEGGTFTRLEIEDGRPVSFSAYDKQGLKQEFNLF